MDDVLSSIRRIIGSDKKDPAADRPLGDGDGDAPMALGTPIRPGGAGSEPPAAGTPADDGALPLTPNMRVDFSKLTDDNPLSGAGAGGVGGGRRDEPAAPPRPEPAAAPEPPAEPVDFLRGASAPAGPTEADHDGDGDDYADEDDEAVVIDEAALEEMIRRIVREELDARAPDDEAMRRVVREELMGETGKNISRNVQALIQSEVKKLLADKG